MSEKNLKHPSLGASHWQYSDSYSPDSAEAPDSACSHSPGPTRPSKASSIPSDILLNIIEKATHEPEDEKTFSLYTYGPLTGMLHPEHKLHVHQYSAVNRWWRAVICDIRPRDIYCLNSRRFRAMLLDLARGKIRAVRTLNWDRRGFLPYDNGRVWHAISDDQDISSPDDRKMLFETFLHHIDGGMRDLILLGSEISPALDVKIHGAWQRVKYFRCGVETIPDCVPVITSILCELRNLESLHLEYLRESYWPEKDYPEYPERPTYRLKSFEVNEAESEDGEFVVWAGGNSRGTLEELSWIMDDERDGVINGGMFEKDLSDVFPGDDLLSLRRVRARGMYLQLLESCNLEALRWIDFDINREYPPSYSVRIGMSLAKCKNLERMWVDENAATIGVVIAHLRAGAWPALVFLHVRYHYGLLDVPTEAEVTELCRRKNITVIVEDSSVLGLDDY